MVFTVTTGWLTSSIKYKRRSEGRARNKRVNAGNTVQIVSISWASRIYRQENLFIRRAKDAYVTIVRTRVNTSMA